ncbi:MAG TPA: PEP-CTERM sorting domain-containing protein [Phycisphaerae bacterium]|nr:PEP-CTERM sorting domain-containing protein [Phycisphaerales bacterium]HRX84521.1 PEP-CTERM sorting domain-containing protein [Phycisphaerae bacterium]
MNLRKSVVLGAVLAIALSTAAATAQESTLIFTYPISMQSGRGEILTEPFNAAIYIQESPEWNVVAPLFEAVEAPSELPATLEATVSRANDADFDLFAELMAEAPYTLIVSPWADGGPLWGGGGAGPLDLRGYVLTHVHETVALDTESPGMDLEGTGVWTDIFVDARYDFYGYPVPEPSTLALILGGIVVLRYPSRTTVGGRRGRRPPGA